MDVATCISIASRRRKFASFMAWANPTPATKVLDSGVADAPFRQGLNFFEAWYPWPERITAVGLGPLDVFQEAFPSVKAITADGRQLPFPADSFDVAFSNAVIEHVGDLDDQSRFVRELCRVAPAVYFTTPNRWFPIETHTRLPLVHWLAKPSQRMIYPRLGVAWAAEELWLLGPREVRTLLPEGWEWRVQVNAMTICVSGQRWEQGAAPPVV